MGRKVIPIESMQCKTCVIVFRKRVVGGYYTDNPEPAFDPWDSDGDERDY